MGRHARLSSVARLAVTAFVFILPTTSIHAWGPHTQITQAALDVLPNKAKWQTLFGDDWQRIARDYCWMGDWQNAVRPDHFADDYLLFPTMPRHTSHMLPEVRQTYAPYFRRALQAVRTESPQNAARWIGSLLHFVQDSGAPPHTIGIGGTLHGKMEQWVDESKITIAGYEPRLFGDTDDDALTGFLNRMEGLVEFSRKRAIPLKPLVEKLETRVNQPLELECALETARMTADIVHTLFTVGLRDPREPGGALEGTVTYVKPAGYATVPAKVMLAGTAFATTTDAHGRYHFRNLPPNKYTVHLLALGHLLETRTDVEIMTNRSTKLEVKPPPDPVADNLVRNPRFHLNWIQLDIPDWWTRDSQKGQRWASALIRVPLDRTCNLRVEFQPSKKSAVFIRWRGNPASPADSREARIDIETDAAGVLQTKIKPDPLQKPFEKGFLFLEVLLQTDRPLSEVCSHIAVTFTH